MSASRKAIELQAINTKVPTAAASAMTAAVAHPVLLSSHQVPISERFNMQGAVALPHTQQFVLFGQWRNEAYAGRQPGNKFNGHLEVRDKDAKHTVTSKKTPTTMVWHTSVLPKRENGPQLLLAMQDNGNDQRNDESFIQTQIVRVNSIVLETTEFLAPVTLQAFTSWLPQAVFRPPQDIKATQATNHRDFIDTHAWRVNVAEHKIEARIGAQGRRATVKLCDFPVFTSSQYVAYSPAGEHAIFGEVGSGNAGIATRRKNRPLTPLNIQSKNFRGAAWFNNSHYVIFCNNGNLIFGCVDYPKAQVEVTLNNTVHALAPIPNEPAVVASEIDGSLNVYNVEIALERLKNLCKAQALRQTALVTEQTGATVAAPPCPRIELVGDEAAHANDTKHVPDSAPAAAAASPIASASAGGFWGWLTNRKPAQPFAPEVTRLMQLIPPTVGFFAQRVCPDVLSDLAALYDADTTTLLQHERGSRMLNVFSLNNKLLYHTILQHLTTATNDVLLQDLRMVIMAYLAAHCFMMDDNVVQPSPPVVETNSVPKPKH